MDSSHGGASSFSFLLLVGSVTLYVVTWFVTQDIYRVPRIYRLVLTAIVLTSVLAAIIILAIAR
jgi:hypothetical protein